MLLQSEWLAKPPVRFQPLVLHRHQLLQQPLKGRLQRHTSCFNTAGNQITGMQHRADACSIRSKVCLCGLMHLNICRGHARLTVLTSSQYKTPGRKITWGGGGFVSWDLREPLAASELLAVNTEALTTSADASLCDRCM